MKTSHSNGIKGFLKSYQLMCGALVVTGLAVGCSMLSKNEYGSNFELRSYKSETLKNGLQIIWIEDLSLPRLSLQLLVKAGAIYESPEESGLHALTAGMLSESTSKYTSQQLAQELEFLGLDFGSRGGSDFSSLSMSGLSQYSEAMIDYFQHILLNPKFDDKDLQRRKANTISGIKRLQDNPSSVADLAFQRELYQDHPYARLVSGHPSTLGQFSTEDCLRIYKVFYQPQRSLLVVSGQVTSQTKEKVRKAFEAWQRWQDIETSPELVTPSKKFERVFHKAGLEQTQIRFGHTLVARNHPDFLKIRAANMVLGGAFASRLNQKIRDDLGLTYSVGSGVDGNVLGGDFTISTFTRHEKVSEMVTEVKKLLAQFVKEGISQAELAGAQSVMIGQFPMALETTDRLGYNLMVLWAYGISDQYLKSFQKTVSEFELAQMNQIISQYFRPEDLSVLIYTDISKTEKQIKGLGILKTSEFSL